MALPKIVISEQLPQFQPLQFPVICMCSLNDFNLIIAISVLCIVN